MTQPDQPEFTSLDALVAYLTWRHARDQEEVAANLALALFPLWQIMRFRELDASTALWVPSVVPRVRSAYYQSQRLTAVYNTNVRFASLPLDDPLPVSVPDVEPPPNINRWSWIMPDFADLGELPDREPVPAGDDFDAAEVSRTLTIEANYNTKKAMPGPEEELMEKALVRSSGAAIREAINGSRNATHNWIRNDRSKIIGYARVTDSDPCPFCAVLASRGAVYTKDSFLKKDASFTSNEEAPTDLPPGFSNIAKVHDHCKCVLRPVYSKSQAMDEAAKHYKRLWNRVDKEVGMWLPTEEKRAGEMKQFKKLLEANPFESSGFDLYGIRRSLADREEELLNAGLLPTASQYRWAQGLRLAV